MSQGTTSVVPQRLQKSLWALAPEGNRLPPVRESLFHRLCWIGKREQNPRMRGRRSSTGFHHLFRTPATADARKGGILEYPRSEPCCHGPWAHPKWMKTLGGSGPRFLNGRQLPCPILSPGVGDRVGFSSAIRFLQQLTAIPPACTSRTTPPRDPSRRGDAPG